MKKLVYLIVAIVVLGLIVSGCIPVVPTAEKDEISSLTKAKPGTDFNGPHYNLNIIGKKSDWSGGGSYDNWDRHTMFVPEDTDGYFTPNGEPGITIWMTQGPEFAVIDGNAFDDGEAAFELGPGTYKVYIVAKAKPGGETDITGWGWVYYSETDEYYFKVGTVNVGGHIGKPQWKGATKLFYVGTEWIFDYLAGLGAEDTAYFWQFDNNGNKLVQVRFYPD